MGGAYDNILMIMILSIFGVTAVLALGSIPDWIKIPEWYKKKLFTVLIIEVVAIVITYSATKLNGPTNEKITYDKNTELSLKYFANDDSIYACYQKDTIGRFSRDKLNYNELFNHIKQPVKDYDDYKVIEWTYDQQTNKWGNTLGDKECAIEGCPFYTRVGYVNGTLAFQIFKQGEEIPYFCSKTSDTNEFNNWPKNNRRVHLFEYMDEKESKIRYVLFRITSADVYEQTSSKPDSTTAPKRRFAHILQVRIRPEFDLKKISSFI